MREQEWIVTRPVVPQADGAGAAPTPLTAAARAGALDERMAVIRLRVREGAYDAGAVAERVARRILARGDL